MVRKLRRLDLGGSPCPRVALLPLTISKVAMIDPILLAQVRRDEGRQPCVYKDTKGLWTIGDGILVDPSVVGAGLLPDEMDYITYNRLARAEATAKAWASTVWSKLSPPRQRIIINMAYNLSRRLFEFHDFWTALSNSNWGQAADAMEDSEWFKEVGDRGKRLVKQMLTGVDQT